jgi:hypothetical protein
VSNVLGSKVNEFVRVLNLTGTSEGLFIGNLWVDRQDWHWFAFHPWSGFEFKMVEPGLYEQWIHRNEHAEFFQGLFHTFQDVNSFNFKDLYVQHPTKPGLWASHGRSDDVVVLSNGYKISPLDTEALVTSHPAVDGCLMVSPETLQTFDNPQATSRSIMLIDMLTYLTDRIGQATSRPPYRAERPNHQKGR